MSVEHQVTPHRLLHEKSAFDLWSSKMQVGPVEDPNSLQYHEVYGIGLNEGRTYGWFITGALQLDCSPDVVEFGDMTFEEDVYFGLSDISWEVRTSPTGALSENDWSPWYTAMSQVPVQQFVQFKFTFKKYAGL
jgi:hypothetical protein